MSAAGPAQPMAAATERLAESAMRSSARRLLPFLVVLYILAFIDRVNVGFGKQAYMADTGLREAAFAFGAGIFFLGYALFEVPSNMILHRVGARRWLGRIMVTWGLVSAAMAWAWTEGVFYTLRFLLGVAEAGFFPGVVLYLTYWFPADRLGPKMGLFYFGAPLAQIIGGPISGLLLEADGAGGLAGWQWMFLVEGLAASAVGLLVFRYLPDRPADACWLSGEEKRALESAVSVAAPANEVGHLWRFLRSRRILLFGAGYGLIQVGVYGVTFYWPAHLASLLGREAGFVVGLVGAVPWMFAMLGAFLLPRRAGRWAAAPRLIAVALAVAAAGVAVSAIGTSWLALCATSVALAGLIGVQPIFWTLPARELSGAQAAGGLALINSLGALGGLAAPNLKVWAETATGFAHAGNIALGLAPLCAGVLIVWLAAARPAATIAPGSGEPRFAA